MIIGTVGYMSPEQATADPALDARSDVFALGCVLFECLTGQPVFAGAHVVAVLAKVLREEAPRVRHVRPDLPAGLDDLIAQMLAKERSQRPRDAAAVMRALEGFGPVSGAAPDPAGSSRAPPVGIAASEQRFVSVILAEVAAGVGAVRAVVDQFGGELSALAGGAWLVTLGGTGKTTEHVARAASCALAILEVSTQMRVVLATGRVQTTGRGLAGPLIDRAAALLAMSPGAGGIRIDDVTAGLLDTRFEVRSEAGALVLRGRRRDLETPRLLLGRATPCVGREKEVALLEATFGECVGESVARAVLVTAPAGFGKSRLRHELVERVRKQSDVSILIARGDPVGAGSAFGLARQLVRHAAQLREGDPTTEQASALRTHLARSFDGEQLTRVADFLGELVSAPSAGDGVSPQLRAARNDARIMSEWLRRSFEEWLGAECAGHPVLVLLEDLHWGDLPSATYLGDALRRFPDRSLMVVALARPEVHEVFPDLWRSAGVQEIRLGGLTRRAAERLVRAVLGDGAPRATVDRLVDRADGNAFYLEELIRRVTEHGDDAFPETVLAVAQSRLEGLEPTARHVLRAASVFGEVAWRGGVATLVGGTGAADVGSWLESLVAREVLVRGRGDRFPGETEYGFRHGLLREAAYSMLTEDDRAIGHRLAGQWLEAAGERDALVLADHHERGGDTARAIPFLVRAAQAAFDGGNFLAALSLAERGRACGAAGHERGRLGVLEAYAHYGRGDWKLVAECANEAMESIQLGTTRWFVAAGLVVNAAVASGELSGAARVLQEVMALPFDPEPTGPYAQACQSLFSGLMAVGQREAARGLYDQLMRVAAAHPDAEPGFRGLVAYIRVLGKVGLEGDLGGAHRCAQEAIAFVDTAGTAITRGLARLNLAGVESQLGRYEEAIRWTNEGLSYLADTDAALFRGWGKVYLAYFLVGAGRHDDAIAQATLALGTLDHVSARTALAHAHLGKGDLDGAESAAREVIAQASSAMTAPWLSFEAATVLARVHLARGRPADALPFEAAAGIARMVPPNVVSDAFLVEAEVRHALGQVEAARTLLRDSRDRILKTAAAIEDAAARASYLAGVKANARTLELAREWLGD
jgi:tetratricopeptide (TPR) repeat protein